MTQLEELNALIDAAKAITGSDSKTAEELGVSRGNISDWRKGRWKCPADVQAGLADIAGLDAEAMAVRAMLKNNEGTRLGQRLSRALGKLSPVIGVVAYFGGAAALGWTLMTSPTPPQAKTASESGNVYYVNYQELFAFRLIRG